MYSGNVLYNRIGKFTTILVSDLPKHIKLYNTIYNIQEVNSTIGNIFVNNQNLNTLSFDKVEPLIVKYKYMILILGSSALKKYILTIFSILSTLIKEIHMVCLIAVGVLLS